MGARLLILIALAVGMAVFLVMRPPKTAPSGSGQFGETVIEDHSGRTEQQQRDLETTKKVLSDRELPGEEPNPRPTLEDFAMTTEVNTSTGKNQICFYISEKHGYYVENLRFLFWYTGMDGNLGPEESPLARFDYINKYIKANETLKHCMELVPAELNQVGGHIGIGKNWAARVIAFDRSRARNPDPLPLLSAP